MDKEYICIQLLVIYFPLEILSVVYNENFSRVSQSIYLKQCFLIICTNWFALVGRNNWAELEQWIKNDTMSSIAVKKDIFCLPEFYLLTMHENLNCVLHCLNYSLYALSKWVITLRDNVENVYIENVKHEIPKN